MIIKKLFYQVQLIHTTLGRFCSLLLLSTAPNLKHLNLGSLLMSLQASCE